MAQGQAASASKRQAHEEVQWQAANAAGQTASAGEYPSAQGGAGSHSADSSPGAALASGIGRRRALGEALTAASGGGRGRGWGVLPGSSVPSNFPARSNTSRIETSLGMCSLRRTAQTTRPPTTVQTIPRYVQPLAHAQPLSRFSLGECVASGEFRPICCTWQRVAQKKRQVAHMIPLAR